MPLSNFRGINLGSGPTGPKDWINIDLMINNRFLREFFKRITRIPLKPFKIIDNEMWRYFLSSVPPNFLRLNLAKGRLPFPDSTFEFCYSSHFFEHLEIWQVERLLAEIHRVLFNGGVCRIVVPDLEIITQAYVNYKQGNNGAFSNLDLTRSPVIKMNEYFGNSYNKYIKVPDILKPAAARWARKYDHKFMYDYDLLRELLLKAGFGHVIKQKFRYGKVPELDILDIENHQFESLYVEAIK
jgi:SAM-dependent methyltransferase